MICYNVEKTKFMPLMKQIINKHIINKHLIMKKLQFMKQGLY